jgi:small-conductance mechanosensitive channel
VAESNPDVLLARPPQAFFMGFGESSLNFELQFWSAWQDKWFQLKSDVAIAVARALREANIEIPFPQRDLRVRTLEAPTADSAGATSSVAVPKRNAAW